MLITKNREKSVAVAIQLCLPDTTDTQHLRGRLWSIRKHLVQGLVMENDIRRHIVLARERLSARSQRFPQVNILVSYNSLCGCFSRCHNRSLRILPKLQGRLATQDTTTGFCQDQCTKTGGIRSQVAGND